MSITTELKCRPASLDDIDIMFDLEINSYPASETASREGMLARLKEATDFFHVVMKENKQGEYEILGFINGTLSSGM